MATLLTLPSWPLNIVWTTVGKGFSSEGEGSLGSSELGSMLSLFFRTRGAR
jgi:hypothetical protein